MKKEIEKLLREICFIVKVEGRLVLKEYSITSAQFDLLQRLYFRGPVKMVDLSQSLGIAKSTLSGIVKRLENAGYVERRRGADKRVYMLSVTDEGRRIIENVIERRVEFIGRVLERIGEERSKELLRLLEVLRKEMEKCRSS
ncbi:MarR family winged helix-turn-helix transcriptional regulator [Thermotoga caldifontis]|uniref:MarR family winged helix-turn-helix transcriptional regulator n=1 Tax=Thermotoga caldifontis TaxID=1508419 RepID=UPI000597E4A0|nr:MarR family transcriptional regulator [Thermotoga caldifontis]